MQRRRVVVTGMGAVTPIGNTLDAYWQGLQEGRNGIELLTRFDAEKFDTRFAGQVTGFDPSLYVDRKSARRLDLYSIFALASAEQAMQDSGIDLDSVDAERFGTVYGSGIGGVGTFQQQAKLYFELDSPQRLSPFFVTMMIADIAAGHISMKYGLKGPNYCTTAACASSANAISDGMMIIQRGNADIMLCGGSEAPLIELSIGGFNSMRAISTWNDRYKEASRPFDKDRNGFVMGEGAGALILEEYEHAKKRGAKIYAELAGFGMTADAHHITAPDPEGKGAYRSMLSALQDAGMQPEDIDYINAHGTSTPYNDKTETHAIKRAFGDHAYNLVVSSVKSMTGHLLGAAGAIESVATVLSIKHGVIPPTINYATPDPDCDLNYSPNVKTVKTVNAAISNAFGFGGHNVSLLFRKIEG